MLQDIVAVTPLDGYRLKLRFQDGVEGIVDVARCVHFTGVFAPLLNREEFESVRVNPELGTIYWPCGADLDPDVLYALLSRKAVASFEPTPPL
jgi:hypothetical protein